MLLRIHHETKLTYTAIKGMLNSLDDPYTRFLDEVVVSGYTWIELGPYGITVNAIAPGFIETAMTAATAKRIGSSIEQMREYHEAELPVRRGGLPDDVAHAATFFASEEAGYVTGQVLYVDGGGGLH